MSQERGEPFAYIADQSLFGVMIVQQGRIRYANAAASKMIGYPVEEMLSWQPQQVLNLVHPEDRLFAAEQAQKRASGDESARAHYAYRVLTKSGETRWVEQHASVIAYEGQPATLAMAVDITERRQAQEAQQRSEHAYRTLVEALPDALFVADREGRITFASPRALALLGVDSPEEVVGRPGTDFVVPERREAVTSRYSGVLASGGSTPRPARLQTKDGRAFPAEASSAVVWDAEGRPQALVVVVRDTTERERAEQALRQSERRYRQLAETAPVGILELARDGRIIYANDGYCRMIGFEAAELKGSYAWAPSPEPEELRQQFQRVMDGQLRPPPWFGDILHKSGKVLHARADWSLQRDEQNETTGMVAVISDVTEPKKLEEQLRHVQKMEAIGTLAGGVAHDINNLLTPILGCADMLSQQATRGSQTHEFAGIIKTAARQCSKLTAQLLGFARKGKLLNTSVDMHHIVNDTVALLGQAVDRSIAISVQLDADVAVVIGDPGQLQQVIMNLGLNARDAMPDGGRLMFRTASVELDEAYCRGHAELTPGRYLYLSVADTGVGMSDEIRERVFEPFFTTKPEGEGSGMGLAMVYGIVRNHGGVIDVRSEVGKGTTFEVYLPVAKGIAVAEEPVRDALSPRTTANILVVDDEEGVRRVVRAMLASLGHRAVFCENGQQAVAYYESHGCQIDLVILDLTMPLMGGRQCFHELKRLDPSVKVLVATGHAVNDAAQALLDAGALGCIQKPFVKAELSEAVAQALGIRQT